MMWDDIEMNIGNKINGDVGADMKVQSLNFTFPTLHESGIKKYRK